MDPKGLLLCARYSVAPNFFGYCGPDKNRSLIDHLKENIADIEVIHILKEFETLYPYLQLIAYSNKIDDPFDRRVVEAYWIGNHFLKNVVNIYPSFLKEKLKIEKKFISGPVLPHHSFHVFNIFKRTGKLKINHTIKTMDECRIGWGKIIKFQISNIKYQNDISNLKYFFVEAKELDFKKNKLILGDKILKKITLDYKNKSYINNFKVGDWVSFHWGMVCDKLTERDVKNLEFYTQQSINYYNLV